MCIVKAHQKVGFSCGLYTLIKVHVTTVYNVDGVRVGGEVTKPVL
jgi:hypothetical protein